MHWRMYRDELSVQIGDRGEDATGDDVALDTGEICVDPIRVFPTVNEVFRRYSRKHPPARIFVNIPASNGGFDIETDCIAAV